MGGIAFFEGILHSTCFTGDMYCQTLARNGTSVARVQEICLRVSISGYRTSFEGSNLSLAGVVQRRQEPNV